jgi:mono/diheme cytochrome c family protein
VTFVRSLLAFLLLGSAGAVAFVWSGLYDISATDQHLAPTYYAIRKTLERSVARRAADIEVPALGAPEQVKRGVALFRDHCVQCHGAPGVPPEPFAMGLTPLPTPLARSGLDRSPAYLYWVIRRGIKMTGMPAWQYRMSDGEIWAVVAFLKALPSLTPAAYVALEGTAIPFAEDRADRAPDPSRGEQALKQYACVACHEIPGMVGPEARLGPSLRGIGSRVMLGGVLPNTPQNMALWILAPAAYSPGTAMPALGVSERDARDIAAYLATLR